ncbi:MAG: sulfotransferase [Bacteroidota bacterium]
MGSLARRIASKSKADWSRISYTYYKEIKYFFTRSKAQKTVVCIVGCQRSGSTMLYKIFCKDPRTKVYQEFSSLSSDDKQHKIRLNPIEKVAKTISRIKHPVVVLKPLVESQRIDALSQISKNTKYIWLYRNFEDVAASNLKKFGKENGLKNLKPVVSGEKNNWRSEHLSSNIVQRVRGFHSSSITQVDAAALFWWVRNQLYFQQNLNQNDRVYTCQYESLVTDPIAEMKKIYAFLSISYPGNHIVSDVHSHSIGKGKDIQLAKEIKAICSSTLEQLNRFKN